MARSLSVAVGGLLSQTDGDAASTVSAMELPAAGLDSKQVGSLLATKLMEQMRESSTGAGSCHVLFWPWVAFFYDK